jgi:hypothetical protein
MLMAFLILSWAWDRVIKDCHGHPEKVSHYYLQATMRKTQLGSCLVGTMTVPCLVTVSAPPVPFGPNISDPGSGNTVYCWLDPVDNPDMLPDPPVGGLAAWPWQSSDNPNPVVAVDMSGNHCDQTCP